jgi:hypothetical protein
MTRHHEFYERGLRIWLTEEKLLSVHFEIFDPITDEAYEVCTVILDYTTDLEQVAKPAIDELEAMLAKLRDLPPGAKFRLVVMRAPGFTPVEGWALTRLKSLKGGAGQTMRIGDQKFGYGPISGELVYTVSNWHEQGNEETGKAQDQ